MSISEDSRVTAPSQPELSLTGPADRRADVEYKQQLIAQILQENACDGLLVLHPDNFAWLTAGATPRGIVDDDSTPALYYTAEGRWLLASNVDTQRLFDEEIDGLGFQLKEWPWHWGRQQLLLDLCQGRNVAADVPFAACKHLATELQRRRLVLTEYERACYRALGQILSHALEAAGRTLARGDTERELAGQLSHRLIHRGATPVVLSIAADGRSRFYRQTGFTGTPIQNYVVMTVAARKYGLCARASRSVVFGQPDALFRKEHDAACKVSATYVASSWPDSVPRQIFGTGQRIYQIVGVEHEWALSPQGHITGHALVEAPLLPSSEDLLQAHWAITWHVSIGAALSCDTFLITEDGPKSVTAVENWPLKRIKVQGAEFVRPDLLIR
ncbi:MAG: M24 family metallopeptidase [Gemmataceae bacterium]